MKITVLGAGSMGSLFGGYLSRNHGYSAGLWEEHVNTVNREGLKIQTGEDIQIFHPMPRL
jgi:2-dehydropantoate 2-reductase